MFHTYQCYVLEQSRACKCFIHTSVMYWNSPEPVNVSYIPVLCIGSPEPVDVSYIPMLCIGTVQSL